MKRYNFAFGFLSIALLALSTAVSSGCTQRVDGVNIKSKAGKRPVASAGSSTAQIVSSEETDSAVTSSTPITSKESFVADLSDEERAKLASESLEKLNIKFTISKLFWWIFTFLYVFPVAVRSRLSIALREFIWWVKSIDSTSNQCI